MLDKRFLQNSIIYNELSKDDSLFWFDFKKDKFLHNIDTFYYSVKFSQDFRFDSKDSSVLKMRRFFENNQGNTNKYGR